MYNCTRTLIQVYLYIVHSSTSTNALLIDLLALLMCNTVLGNANTWPDVAFFPLETRVRELGVLVTIPCFGDDLLS